MMPRNTSSSGMKFSHLNRVRFNLDLYPEERDFFGVWGKLTWATMIVFSLVVYGRIAAYYVWGGQ